MQFKAMSDRDIESAKQPSFLLKKGLCDFKVINATEKVSSNQNPMMEIEIEGFDGINKVTFRDYLVYSDKAMWKLVTFCKAVGLSDNLKKGELRVSDVKGRTGVFENDHDERDVIKDKGALIPEFVKRTYNKVKRYVDDTNEINHLASLKDEQGSKPIDWSKGEDLPF